MPRQNGDFVQHVSAEQAAMMLTAQRKHEQYITARNNKETRSSTATMAAVAQKSSVGYKWITLLA